MEKAFLTKNRVVMDFGSRVIEGFNSKCHFDNLALIQNPKISVEKESLENYP